jgi:hypothetical protein
MRSSLFESVLSKSLDRKSFKDGEVFHERSIHEVVELAKDFFEKNLKGKIFKTKSGKGIAFTQKGFREFFYSATSAIYGGQGAATGIYKERFRTEQDEFDVFSVVTALEDIIKNMDFHYYEPNKKADSKPDVRKYDTYRCDVVIDGDRRECRVRVEVPFDGPDRYYFHYLEQRQRYSQILTIDGFRLS